MSTNDFKNAEEFEDYLKYNGWHELEVVYFKSDEEEDDR